MIRFTEYSLLIEGKKVTVPALKNLIGKEKVFVLFGGTMGAGKTTWANANLKGHITILDPDDIGISQKNSQVKKLIAQGESVVDMGTMANEQASLNKLKLAKDAGFTTVAILISTTPEEAIKRNRARIAGGGRGVAPEKEGKIAVQYENALKSFKTVKRQADYFMEIKS